MTQVLRTLLWAKFAIAIFLIIAIVLMNFLLLSTEISAEIIFYILLIGKPLAVALLILLQNLLFSFHGKISIHNLIPSSFLLISIILMIDLLFWGYAQFELLSPHQVFWVIYGFVLGISTWNIWKYVRAFTTGI